MDRVSQLGEESSTSYYGFFTHSEAACNEVTQLAPSGCGVTALVNVLLGMGELDKERSGALDYSRCALRRRANEAPLPEYLASRSVAGCTGEELISSMCCLIESNPDMRDVKLRGKFYSSNEIEETGTLTDFIRRNIELGHAMIATLNLQLFGNDAWHHQMIYGITIGASPAETLVHMMNPVEYYPIEIVRKLISTPSVLLVRREDIISRYDRPATDSSIYDSPEWAPYKVREQIRAVMDSPIEGGSPSHVVIPAIYVGGICVFERVGSRDS